METNHALKLRTSLILLLATQLLLPSKAEDFTDCGPCDSMYCLNYGPASGGCKNCGKHGGCKICRLVPEERKITVVCWGIKDEDFCIPGPSCPQCEHSECVCASCPSKDTPLAKPKRMTWTDWLPSQHAHIHTRHKLMKRTVTKTVAGFKWVVEDLCADCRAQCVSCEVSDQASIPLPPPKPN